MAETRRGKVIKTERLSDHVCELTLALEGEQFAYLPGQWLSLQLPVGDRPPLNRAYTLALPPSCDGKLTLCFDRVEGGTGSNYLFELPVGEVLSFTGPHGNFRLPEGNQEILMVAHYTGIVPFRAMLKALEQENIYRSVHLVYSCPDESERIYHSELLELRERSTWFKYHFPPPHEEFDFLNGIKLAQPFIAMVCGVRDFTLPTRNLLMELFGLDRRAIKVENYSGPSG